MILLPRRDLILPSRDIRRVPGFSNEDYAKYAFKRRPYRFPPLYPPFEQSAAVAFDNAASAKSATLNTTISVTMTPGALTNPCALVFVGWGNPTATTVSTVKLDTATAFTRFGGVTGVGNDNDGLDIWRLVGASITNASHTFDVVMSANTEIKFIHAITFSGVDQATPLGTIATDNTDNTSPTAISPAGGGASDLEVCGFFIDDGLGTGTYGVSNLTLRGTTQTDAAILGASCSIGTASGTQASLGGTWTTAASRTLTAGVVIKAAAAGGATRPVKMAGEWGGYAGVGGGFAG